MGHYVVNDHINVTARFEYEQQKTAGVTQKNEEFTTGCALPFASHLELRPEICADFGSPANFNEGDPLALKSPCGSPAPLSASPTLCRRTTKPIPGAGSPVALRRGWSSPLVYSESL